MTKKIKRTPQLEISLEVKDDSFIRPPLESQRNSLLNRAMKEFAEDLKAIDKFSARFVKGNTETNLGERTQSELSDEDIMEEWQLPIMERMSEIVTKSGGDVLEIGFGLGVSSSMIQANKPNSHTIIECNDSVVLRFHEWKTQYPNQKIELVHGLWQDTIYGLGEFDSIFFHTYPLNEEEYMDYVHASVTFAAHFFETASKHLKSGGVFTYFSNEIDSLSRAHQRLLFEHFSSFSSEIINLKVPENVKDTWWADSMVVVSAVK